MRPFLVGLFCLLLTACGRTSTEIINAQSHFIVEKDYPHILNVRYGLGQRRILYFPGNSKLSPVLNVFVLAPVGTYDYYPNRKRFDLHNTYQQLPDSKHINSWVETWQSAWGIDNLVFLSLPGTFGSGNETYEYSTPQAIDALDDAVTQLKAKYGASRVNIGGQSASGEIVSGLLSRRKDLFNVIFGATRFDPRNYIEARQWPSDYTGVKLKYSPIDDVAHIKISGIRKILVISDPNDTIVPYAYSKAYVDAVHQRGHEIMLETVHTKTDDHHGLTSWAITRLIQRSKD
jgi:hypothetical protein